MPRLTVYLLLVIFVCSIAYTENVTIHIPTSEVVRIAQIIAKNEGYQISNHNLYYFDSLDTQGTPLVRGYTSIGFYINGNIRSTISISEITGQAIDMNTCEIFDYPELKPFQKQMIQLSKAKIKTAQELADDVGCSSPKVLTKSNPISD
jgi:hypothetical protein